MIKKSHQFRLFIAIAFFCFLLSSVFEIYKRARIDIDGIIISRTFICIGEYKNRCYANYTIQSLEDNTRNVYNAWENDYSLSVNMNEGSYISKNKWDLGYSVDKVYRLDFPLKIYLIMIAVEIIIFLQGIILLPSMLRILTSREYWTSK